MGTVLLVAAALLAVASLAQALRIGRTRGDWSGFIPVVVVVLVVALVWLFADTSAT